MLSPGLLYFAYGCNMDPATLADVIGTELEPGGPALVDGWRLAFNHLDEGDRVVASLVEASGCISYGAVYRLPREALSALDEFEEVPERYRHETLWVEPLGRRARQAALAYIGQPNWTVEEREPDPEYLELLIRGANAHGLPEALIMRNHWMTSDKERTHEANRYNI